LVPSPVFDASGCTKVALVKVDTGLVSAANAESEFHTVRYLRPIVLAV
jgi:hypothetical protein